MTLTPLRRVAILGGNRIPFARSNTAYARASNLDLLTTTLQGLVDRFGLNGQRLGDVVAGAVMKHSRDFNLVREAVLSTTLSPETPAFDIQQACGTGLEAALLVANKIAVGQIECGVAGGVDTTSDAPIALHDGLRRTLLDLSRARTLGQRLGAALRIRPAQFLRPELPRNGEPRTGLSMGEHAELMAREWGISRQEQDSLALHSHHNLAQAYERDFFVDLMTPFQGLREDNNLRRGLTAEQLAKLKPVFRINKSEKVFLPDGTLKEERPLKEMQANILGEFPIRPTGKLMPRKEMATKLVFAKKYQLSHVNGLTFDFLMENSRSGESDVDSEQRIDKPLINVCHVCYLHVAAT